MSSYEGLCPDCQQVECDEACMKATCNVELLPLPWSDVQPNGRRWLFNPEDRPRVEDYARANVEANTEALRAEVERLKRIEFCWNEWLEKTEWVQQTCKPKELGMHRADVLRLRIEQAEARAERLTEALRRIEGLEPAEFNEPETLGLAAMGIAHGALHPTAAQEVGRE